MKKKQFRMMAILWLIGTIILQSIPAYAQNDEIGLRSSSSSFQYSVFELRNMAEWQKVIGVTVNEEEYQKVSEKSELSQGKKYHLPDAGFLEPKVYISKLKKDDIVKFITAQGYLQVKINNPNGMFGIHDKKSVKFVVKPEEPKPEEPAEPEITLLVKHKWNNDFIAKILPTPKEGEVQGIEIDGEPYEKGNFKYSYWNNPKTYYLENGDLYLFEPAEGAVLTLTYANGKKYSFKYLKSERKFEPLKNSNPNKPQPNEPQQPDPNQPKPNPDPQQPEKRKVTVVVKHIFLHDFMAEISPTPKAGEVIGVSINDEPYQAGSSKYSPWNGNPKTYYLENGDLYLFEPKEGDILTLTYSDGQKYSFRYLKSEKKFEPLMNPNDPQQPNPNDPQQPNPNDPQQPNPNDPQQPNPNDPQQPNPKDPQQPNPKDPQQPNPKDPQQPNPNDPQQPNPNDPQQPNPNDPQQPNPKDPQQPNPNDPQQPNPNTSAPVLTPYVPAAETETRPTVPHAAAKEEIKQPEMKKEDDSTTGTEELTENQIPEGAVAETQNIPATISEKMVDAEEMKETPLPLGAPELPKTAGIPAESLCLFGLGAAIVGFWLKRQK